MNEPVTIDPDAIFDENAIRDTFGLRHSTIDRARREGKLQPTRIGSKRFYKGAQILAWLRGESSAAPRERTREVMPC